MSGNFVRSVAAEVQRAGVEVTRRMREDQIALLDKTSAYWYACGYNDNRHPTEPYVDPQAFAEHWLVVSACPSHHSLQDTFKAYRDGVTA